MLVSLRGKTALVTGAARRIGRVIVLALAQEGVNVVFNHRTSATEAEKTEKDLQATGVKALALQADLTDLDACDVLLKKTAEAFGQVDILINNASDFPRSALKDLRRNREKFSQQLDYLVRLHMRAPLYLSMQLGLQMKENGWGRIVNITDRVTVKGQAYRNWILYLATKYGLYGVTQALAEELAPEVLVNSIAPGLVLPPTEISRQQRERLLQRIPLKREVDAQEIAMDVLHLVRSNSKTGAVILTNGGASLHAS